MQSPWLQSSVLKGKKKSEEYKDAEFNKHFKRKLMRSRNQAYSSIEWWIDSVTTPWFIEKKKNTVKCQLWMSDTSGRQWNKDKRKISPEKSAIKKKYLIVRISGNKSFFKAK